MERRLVVPDGIDRLRTGRSVPLETIACLAQGIPARLFDLFIAEASVRWIDHPRLGWLIQVGHSMAGDVVCVMPSGVVVSLPGFDPPMPSSPQSPGLTIDPVPVNAGLDEFKRCVDAVLDEYPLFRRPSDTPTRIAIANRLRSRLQEIDASAAGPDSFWSGFADSVVMGDFIDAVEDPQL